MVGGGAESAVGKSIGQDEAEINSKQINRARFYLIL